MRTRAYGLYSLVQSDYDETFDYYVPRTKDFYDLVSSRLSGGWEIRRQQLWFVCSSQQNLCPYQGWKIHVSSSLANAREVLDRVSALLLQRQDTTFKFSLDLRVLQLVNGKNFPRGGSSKFITIYPQNDHCFLELIESLRQELKGFQGPYILSDRRYKDSGVVFYRYGGMRLREKLNVKGESVPVLITPDGSSVPDQRLPYPITPDWVCGPLAPDEPADNNEASPTLKQGRYTIESVIDFSNAGGVYKAFDHLTRQPVVIKEARPFVNESFDGYDAVELLKKEHRLLTVIADTGIAPQPVDLFQDWEHWFLVEEYIDGMVLGRYSAAHNILLRTRPLQTDYVEWQRTFVEISLNLIRMIEVLHSRGIVFADLSANNVMVLAGGTSLKLIDFEGAYQKEIDRPTNLFTPGFVSPNRLQGMPADIESDYYSLGAVLFAYLFPWNGLIQLKREAIRELMESIRKDSRLPRSITSMIIGLMNHDPGQPTTPARLGCLMDEDSSVEVEPVHELRRENYPCVLERIVDHWKSTVTYEREDRLFPADARLFATNPLSLAFGACGVAYAWHKITGGVPSRVLQWISNKRLTHGTYAPGLYIGLAGIAWSLLEMGLQAEAETAMRQVHTHPLAFDACDLLYGVSGWGMADLRFWMATNDRVYLAHAVQAGNHLVEQCKEDGRGCYWGEREGAPLGLARGSSGIALFLLYLYLATKNERFLYVGRRALDFDLSFGLQNKDAGLTWPMSTGSTSPVYPYWQHGSAGIGIATARYYRLLGESCYEQVLDKIYLDTDRKYAVFAGRFTGLAGIGEFLLDMHDLTAHSRYRESAARLAEGIMNFRVERKGIAFPGNSLFRLSCDFGTGSAGIALFLNRLLGNQQNDFMLDSLFARDGTLFSEEEQALVAMHVGS